MSTNGRKSEWPLRVETRKANVDRHEGHDLELLDLCITPQPSRSERLEGGVEWWLASSTAQLLRVEFTIWRLGV